MIFNSKKLCIQSFLYLLLVNLILYASYHLSYLFTEVVALAFIHQYLREIADFLIPAMCALIMLTVYTYRGLPRAIGAGALLFSSRIIYYLLFHYVELVVFNGSPVSSTDALLLSSLYTVVLYAVGFIHSLALFGIGLLVAKLLLKKQKKPDLSIRDGLKSQLPSHVSYNLTSPISLIIFIISLCQFLFHICFEIFDTVSFFTEFGLTYTTGELIYIVWRYIFFILLLAGCHVLASYFKNRIFESGKYTEEDIN